MKCSKSTEDIRCPGMTFCENRPQFLAYADQQAMAARALRDHVITEYSALAPGATNEELEALNAARKTALDNVGSALQAARIVRQLYITPEDLNNSCADGPQLTTVNDTMYVFCTAEVLTGEQRSVIAKPISLN